MGELPPDKEYRAFNSKLKTLMAIRVFFVTAILGTFFVFHIGYRVFPHTAAVTYLIVFQYSLTFAYAFLIGRLDAYRFAYAQIFIDASSALSLILFTGGIESWFTPVLLLVVLEAAIVINKNAGYLSAAFEAALFGIILYAQYMEFIPLPFDHLLMYKDFLYKAFTISMSLFLMSYFTGELVSRIERSKIDYAQLSKFNMEVIESTPSGLFTTDLNGNIEIFNRAAESITGVGRHTAAGSHASIVFPFLSRMDGIIRAEEAISKGGQRKVIGITVSALKDAQGLIRGYIGVFQDLTELKALSEEIKKNEKLAALGEMSANMAHEIRNPLASLKGSIEMLKENSTGQMQRERLMDIALMEMDRLNRIITEFLDYSKPMPLHTDTFDINSVLDSTIELLKSREDSNSDISFIKDYSGELMVRGDAQRLQQVFLNLGLNALDAMPRGGELIIGSGSTGSGVRVYFSDTGIGIPKENADKVFYPFFTTKHDGTGLGLSIAYRIVEEHNGKITVSSETGKGSRFDILLRKGIDEG